MRERGGGGVKQRSLANSNSYQFSTDSFMVNPAAVLVLLASPYRRARSYQHSRCNAWTGPTHGRQPFKTLN